jgi:hypothetical protein
MSAGTDRAGFEPAGIEQRLKAEIDRYPVRVRPELAREAYQAHRRHRVIRRSAGALGAAAVIALAVTLATTGAIPFSAARSRPASPMSSVPQLPASGIPDPSLLPIPPGNGLTDQQAARDILWERTTHVTAPASDSMVENSFSYGVTGFFSTRLRDTFYAKDGQAYQDHSEVTIPQAGGIFTTVTQVDYSHRTWSQSGNPSSLARGERQSACADIAGDGLGMVNFALRPDVARGLLSCPGLVITRGTEAGGIAAIKIADHRGIALWVNEATYLPIKMVSVWNIGHFYLTLPNEKRATVSTTEYGYLVPTKANLRYLSVPLPRGFTGSSTGMPTGQPVATWTPPPGAIPPFGLRPAAPGDSLTPAAAAGDIAWIHSTIQAIPASDTVVDNIFRYKTSSSDLTYYPDGKPWDEDFEATIPGPGGKAIETHTVVNWEKRTYSVDTSPAVAVTGDASIPPQFQPGSCVAVTASGVYSALDPGAGARWMLSCPGVTVSRGLTFEGVGAVKLTSGHGQTLWVNATTYLPIEAVLANSKGDYPPAGYHGAKSPGQVIQYTWLAPTLANLAYLSAPMPPGFTKVA